MVKKEKQCIDCQSTCILHKAQRCHNCYKKYYNNLSKIKRDNPKKGLCSSCKNMCDIYKKERCHKCFLLYDKQCAIKCKNNQKNGICIDCKKDIIIFKSQRCHNCFKIFDYQRAKENIKKKKEEGIIKTCNDCKKERKIHIYGKCHDCFKKKAAMITKQYRERITQEKKKLIPEEEKIPENHKKCTSCNSIKEIGDFYASTGNKCKDCGKKEGKEQRICSNEKKKIIDDLNIKYKCRHCGNIKLSSEFRPNRKKCKSCEAEYTKNYVKPIVSENNENNNIDKNEYFKKRREEINEKNRERLKNDIAYKLKQACRRRLLSSIKKKYRSDKYIGCETELLIEWLQFCFGYNMTLENHGKLWHIDHVIPLDIFDLSNEEQQFIAFNWKNLSPETAKFNMEKGNKIIKSQVDNHIQKLKDFHKMKNMDIPHEYIEILEQKCKTSHNDREPP
jgi:hypothetical protein